MIGIFGFQLLLFLCQMPAAFPHFRCKRRLTEGFKAGRSPIHSDPFTTCFIGFFQSIQMPSGKIFIVIKGFILTVVKFKLRIHTLSLVADRRLPPVDRRRCRRKEHRFKASLPEFFHQKYPQSHRSFLPEVHSYILPFLVPNPKYSHQTGKDNEGHLNLLS